MKLLTELLTLRESVMADRHLQAQETLMDKFAFGEEEAEEVLEFVLKSRDWEDLTKSAREKLYSHYQKTMPYGTAKAKTADPYLFIGKALRKDLGL